MVSEVAEFDKARALVDREWALACARGVTLPKALHVGAMLEVPSLYFQLPALLERVDFLSAGSKDLLLFLFASDRGNPQVGARYDTLSPALLRLLRDVVRMCNNASIPVSLCGEMVGQPLEAMALIGIGIGIGFRHLSMNANAVGGVRLMAAASIQMRLATTSRRSSTAPITASEASCRRSRETGESRSKKLIKLNCIDPYCY